MDKKKTTSKEKNQNYDTFDKLYSSKNEHVNENGPQEVNEDQGQRLLSSTDDADVEICYDELLDIIGKVGTKQILVFSSYSIGNTLIMFVLLSPVFLAAFPRKMNCKEPGLEKLNLSRELIRNISVGGLDECHMYHRDYSNWTMQTVQNWIETPFDNHTEVVECMYGYEYDPYPYKDTIVTEWDLVCGNKWKAHLPSVFLGLGKFGANIFLGYFSDKIGRVRPYVVCYISSIGLLITLALSPNLYIYCISKFSIGFTCAVMYTCGIIIVTEFFGMEIRGVFMLLYHSCLSIGVMMLALLAYVLRSWSSLLYTFGLISSFGLLTLFWIEESPRWLFAKGREKESFRILKIIAKSNKRLFPENVNVVKEGQTKEVSYFDLFSTKNLALIGFICCLLGSANATSYFGLSYYLSSISNSPQINFLISGIVEFVGLLLSQILVKKISRRRILSTVLILDALMICAFLSDWILLKTFLALLGKAISVIIYPVLFCLVTETYPTEARGKAFSCVYFCYNIAFIVVPQIITISETHLVVFVGVVTLVSGVLVNFLPETKDQPLCDTLEEMKLHRRIVCFE